MSENPLQAIGQPGPRQSKGQNVNQPGRASGFTLIELVIVMAIVAILSAIAMPSYQGYVLKSRRADGKAALMRIQLQQEKWRASHLNFTNALADLRVGTTSTDGHYTLSVWGSGATDYDASATAVGGQTADKAGATACATLTLQVRGNSATFGPAACWQ